MESESLNEVAAPDELAPDLAGDALISTDVGPLLSLRRAEVSPELLYLDPNNPRLVSLHEETPDEYEDCDVVRTDIQDDLLGKIKADVGIGDLIAKIRTNGFLRIDRIVVRELNCSDPPSSQSRYVILEGNRRVAALKTIMNTPSMTAGLTDPVKASFAPVEVLVYEGSDPSVAWQIQGLRHIESIKQWGAYQRGRYLHDTGKKASDLKELTGISVREINKLLRSYAAFTQALEDEDWGSALVEEDFSIFQEGVFGRPALQTWLEWSDKDFRFKNTSNLTTLLKLRKEEANGSTRIANVNPELRDRFGKLVETRHHAILERFLNDEDLGLEKAYAESVSDETEGTAGRDLETQKAKLDEADTTVVKLPVAEIITQPEVRQEFISLLARLKDHCHLEIKLLETDLSEGASGSAASEA